MKGTDWLNQGGVNVGQMMLNMEREVNRSLSEAHGTNAALARRVQELEKALDAAQDDAARLRAVILKSPEWVYNRNEDDGWCVHCKRWYTEGHAPDCVRQAALAQTSEVKHV